MLEKIRKIYCWPMMIISIPVAVSMVMKMSWDERMDLINSNGKDKKLEEHMKKVIPIWLRVLLSTLTYIALFMYFSNAN